MKPRLFNPLLVVLLLQGPMLQGAAAESEHEALFSSIRLALPNGLPGGAVAIVTDGVPDKLIVGGLAQTDPPTAINAATPFYIASLAKPLTAIAILTLAHRDQLDLRDAITHYISDLPGTYDGVSLQALLTHQGGVPDYFQWLDEATPATPMNGDIRRLIDQHPELDFQPGTDVRYSNTAYVLLAEVVQRVDGRSMARWLAEEIFRPLDMSDSLVLEPGTALPDKAAQGYALNESGPPLADDYQMRTTGAGGVYASLRDLVKFDAELRAPRVIAAEVLQAMHTPATLMDGTPTPFAPGWIAGVIENDGPLNGMEVQQVFGDLAGFRAAMRRFSQGTTVIWLSNNGRHLFNLEIAEAWLSAQ